MVLILAVLMAMVIFLTLHPSASAYLGTREHNPTPFAKKRVAKISKRFNIQRLCDRYRPPGDHPVYEEGYEHEYRPSDHAQHPKRERVQDVR